MKLLHTIVKPRLAFASLREHNGLEKKVPFCKEKTTLSRQPPRLWHLLPKHCITSCWTDHHKHNARNNRICL